MDKVSEIRQRELRQLKNAAYLNASFAFTFTCAPFMVRFSCNLLLTDVIIPTNLKHVLDYNY